MSANAGRFVLTQYCDDVRQEVGGKLSLIGCYGTDLIVDLTDGPVVLPKLCAQVRVFTPVDHPFERLVIRAFLNDETIAEIAVPESSKVDGRLSPPEIPDARWLTLSAIFSFVPFVVGEANGTLSVEVESEEGTIRGNSLRLIVRQATRS